MNGVVYDDVITNYATYNLMSSCTTDNSLSQSECSSIAESSETLDFDVERSNRVYSLQASFSTNELFDNKVKVLTFGHKRTIIIVRY